MKIAFFTDCYLDLTGGITTAINAEKAELERLGHTVYVFSSAYPRSDKEKQKLATEHIFPVPSCRLIGRGATPIARRPKIIEKWLMNTHPELKEFDIFYVHYEAGCSIAGLHLAKSLDIPAIQVMHGREDVGEAKIIPFGLRTIVATALNTFHSWYLPHPVKVKRDDYLAQTIASAKMWTLMINHANAADLVITPSENFRDILIHYGVTKEIIPLHHGVPDHLVDAKASPRTLKSGEPLEIIWHSRVSGEKRILPFLEALAILTENKLFHAPHFSYHLDVYGDGPDLPLAKAFSKLHRLNVEFHGDTDYEVILEKLRQAHLDVLISYNYDTFGMILIEAEASGVPVFIADPALKEIVPEGGFLLSSGPAPEQMAASMSELLGHPEMIEKMSRTMLKSRQSVRISATVSCLEKIMASLSAQWKTRRKTPQKSQKSQKSIEI